MLQNPAYVEVPFFKALQKGFHLSSSLTSTSDYASEYFNESLQSLLSTGKEPYKKNTDEIDVSLFDIGQNQHLVADSVHQRRKIRIAGNHACRPPEYIPADFMVKKENSLGY